VFHFSIWGTWSFLWGPKHPVATGLYCSLSICLNLFRFRVSACFAYDKTVINQRRVEKSTFENQSEENSVWILQLTTLLGIFCKIGFTPAVIPCYQVHALNADEHLSAALLCYFRCNWCKLPMPTVRWLLT